MLVPLIFTFLATTVFAQTVNVPLSHWIYDVLSRWETEGFIPNIFEHTKPYSRMEVAEYLKPVFEIYAEDPGKLSRVDREYLDYSAVEFREELERVKARLPQKIMETRFQKLKKNSPLKGIWPSWVYPNQRNTLVINHDEFNFYADPVLEGAFGKFVSAGDTLQRRNRQSDGFLMRGNMGEHIGYYFMLMQNRLFSNPPIPNVDVLEESGFQRLDKGGSNETNVDENVAYVTFNFKYFNILFGREYNQWGAGEHGQLVLSTNAPVMDQVKLTVRYWRFKFTYIAASLVYIAPGARKSIKDVPPTDVYWSGTRMEVNLGKGFRLGASQSVIYGGRNQQPGYLNPVAFFSSVEHFYGDLDNTAFSTDFSWRILPGFKTYGEILIDDNKLSKLGSDFFGNKFGYKWGTFWVNPLGVKDVDFLAEYTRVKPYVYSHTFKDFNKYKHYDTIIGDFIGPNSDDWFLRLRKYFHRRLRLEGTFEHYRHGKNLPDRNVGGDPDRPWQTGDSRRAPFLDGQLITRTVWSAELRYEALRNLFLTGQYHLIRSESVSWRTALFFRIGINFGYRKEIQRPFQPAIN